MGMFLATQPTTQDEQDLPLGLAPKGLHFVLMQGKGM
jgi:hypothetical protein